MVHQKRNVLILKVAVPNVSSLLLEGGSEEGQKIDLLSLPLLPLSSHNHATSSGESFLMLTTVKVKPPCFSDPSTKFASTML